MKMDDPDPCPSTSRKRGRLGVNVSTNVKFGKDTLRASVLYGEGIENYMNDAPVDVGPKATTNPRPDRRRSAPRLRPLGVLRQDVEREVDELDRLLLAGHRQQ
jgi:hypothetical protein